MKTYWQKVKTQLNNFTELKTNTDYFAGIPWLCCCLYYPFILMIISSSCTNTGPGAGKKWTGYPSLAKSTKTYRWLVVKVQLSDAPQIPPGIDNTINQFFGIAGTGYGNLVDYFHDVSYNHASVIADAIVGWIPVTISKADLRPKGRLFAPGLRLQRIQECLQAIPADQLPPLDEFYGVVVINNVVNDGGAATVGQQPVTVNNKTFNLAGVWFDPNSLYTQFAAHEIAHGLGLNHSYDDANRICANGAQPGEYCDQWDIMSSLVNIPFADANWTSSGQPATGGPGMDAPNLLTMGWIPAENRRSFDYEGGEQIFKINALSHPRPNEPLVVTLNVGSNITGEGIYTVEYRQGDGWDQGFVSWPAAPPNVRTSGGTVLVHQYRPIGQPSSTLINGAYAAALQPCNTVVFKGLGGLFFHIKVLDFDRKNGSARVSIGFGRNTFSACDYLKDGISETNQNKIRSFKADGVRAVDRIKHP